MRGRGDELMAFGQDMLAAAGVAVAFADGTAMAIAPIIIEATGTEVAGYVMKATERKSRVNRRHESSSRAPGHPAIIDL